MRKCVKELEKENNELREQLKPMLLINLGEVSRDQKKPDEIDTHQVLFRVQPFYTVLFVCSCNFKDILLLMSLF